MRSCLSQALWLSLYVLSLIGLTTPVLAQENVFEYGDFSLTLPEGWVKQDIPIESEKELIGSFKSQDIPGTSVLTFFYQGGRYNYSSVRIVGLKTIASVFPNGQEMVKEGKKVETDGGLTAVIELWRGLADAKGTPASLQVPMGIIETKAGWILMLGFTPEPTGAQLEDAFSTIIHSARYESEP